MALVTPVSKVEIAVQVAVKKRDPKGRHAGGLKSEATIDVPARASDEPDSIRAEHAAASAMIPREPPVTGVRRPASGLPTTSSSCAVSITSLLWRSNDPVEGLSSDVHQDHRGRRAMTDTVSWVLVSKV